ncbi:MAG: acyl-CoA reductase [Lachnospiraceae bacterium]|nr:acyl-CoA reductase [Lachnospiraceae bacterium]
MPTILDPDALERITYLTGSASIVPGLSSTPARVPFDDGVVDFLNEVSRELMRDRAAKAYPDLITFGFWIRKSSVRKLKERFKVDDGALRLGRGLVFHVAPSNVPVNFAYSLAAGLLSGNANVVRVPSRDFPQVEILADVFRKVLADHEEMKPYVLLLRYGRDKDINDWFSSIADVRIVWGGDRTIAELRKSELPPRSGEITFADRYSLAVIDSDSYLAIGDKAKVAEDFYNDTLSFDQNACTSPRIIVWTGKQIERAKKIFWEKEHELAAKKYAFQAIQSVDKLTKSYLIAAVEPGVKIEARPDNRIVRVTVPKITNYLMDYRGSGGYFYEYNCEDILEIRELCGDKRCQTIAYIGDGKAVLPLIRTGIKGIDRVVPMGKTMDFDLIWDGYNLPALLSRAIVLA